MSGTKSFLRAVLCGAVSFLLVFFTVPALCAGWPDVLWIALCLLEPVAAALILLKGSRPLWVFAWLLAQWLLAFLLSGPLCRVWGINPEGLGIFAFLGMAVLWPAAVTLAQYLALRLLRR